MECPFCYTNFEYHLSICTSCGKDTDDPLYQELFSRVKPRKIEETAPVKQAAVSEAAAREAVADAPPEPATRKDVRERPAVTAEIRSKNTCNTLVDFPGKKAELPEWRLELQSRLKDIQDQRKTAEPNTQAIPAKRHAIGGTGLAMAVLETPETPTHPLMQKALERIERSRLKNEPQSEPKSYSAPSYAPYTPQTYAPAAYTPAAYAPAPYTPPAAPKTFPRVVTLEEVESESGVRPFIYSENETVETRLSQIGLNHAERLAEAAKIKNDLIAGEKFSTNKLRKPETAASFSGSNGSAAAPVIAAAPVNAALKHEEAVKSEPKSVVPVAETAAAVNFEDDEAEEIAPFAFRFNAGLFDFIISGFLSLILLSPFMVLGGGNWATIEGLFAFLATCSIVMFLYITAAVGLIGRTLGMGLFSLEMIDAADNDYPTFHQAAVSSSLYLVSLALGGIGFATMFWNEEKRAVHDLVSGTIVVRET